VKGPRLIRLPRLKIPVCAPKLGAREIRYVTECIKSSWVSGTSPYVSDFEMKFAKYCRAKFGIATNSGTTALHLALAALGIGKGDEVIMPTFTMIATANATTYTGARCKLVDSELDTWNLDVSKVEPLISKKTKAIMAVHTYGHPVDMGPLLDIARQNDLYVVEDAAEAHGAEYKGHRVGCLGDIGCFSFYSNKIITTGEGGMIVTNDEETAERCRWLRAHAFGKKGKHFWHERIGFGYRMSGLQAALGLAQLERIDRFVKARRSRAELYAELLRNMRGLALAPEAPWAKSVFWMYSVLVQKNFGMSREALMRHLARKGIETRTFFYPIHRQPAYRHICRTKSYPRADYLSAVGVNLPSGNNLTEDEIRYICRAISAATA